MAYIILIVDDEPEMVQMLSRSLSRNGYEIITAFRWILHDDHFYSADPLRYIFVQQKIV